MKKFAALFTLLSSFALCQSHAQTDLLSLGSATFSIDPGSTAGYTQTVSGVSYTSFAGSDTFYNDVAFTPTNWSTFSDFGLKISLLSGTPDSIPFSVIFYDASFAVIDTYTGDTSTVNGSNIAVPLTLTPGTGSGDYSVVNYFQFTWDAGATYNAQISSVMYNVPVPEPSTYALLALSGVALGGYAMRRRRRA
jgi:hypothetical protein